MRPEAIIPLIATVISLELTFALFRRWRVSRRPYLRSWALSLAFFAVGCGALWYGTAFGFSSPSFRTYYICGALLSVPWLAQGELELLVRPAFARVTLAFLILFSLDAAITLAAVPFVDDLTVSGYDVPHGQDRFGALPRVLVVIANSVGTLVVVGGVLWSGWRSRGRGPIARARFRGTLVILLGVLVAAAAGGLTFLGPAYASAFTACLAASAAIMYAGFVLSSRRPGSHRSARRRRRAEEAAETFAPGEQLDAPAPQPSPEPVSR